MPSAYQTLQSQNKLKTQYILFWSYYGPGRLHQNRTLRGGPQDVVCRLNRNENFVRIFWDHIIEQENPSSISLSHFHAYTFYIYNAQYLAIYKICNIYKTKYKYCINTLKLHAKVVSTIP